MILTLKWSQNSLRRQSATLKQCHFRMARMNHGGSAITAVTPSLPQLFGISNRKHNANITYVLNFFVTPPDMLNPAIPHGACKPIVGNGVFYEKECTERGTGHVQSQL
jgi:hypothetical protein